MTQSELSGKAIRHLRALGHHLEPVVHVGKDGVTKGVVHAVDAALTDHELVKVRLHQEVPLERRDAGHLVAIRTGAVLVQVLGRVLLLYRRHPETPKIVLPERKDPAP
jgi:RNA-binding protein